MEEVETEYKQVWETDEDNYTEKQTELLDKLTTDLPEGLYFVEIISGNNIYKSKMIINR